VDSCHAHSVDKKTTVDEKNCKLILQGGQLSLVATKTITHSIWPSILVQIKVATSTPPLDVRE
jgi:hypothetical protein